MTRELRRALERIEVPGEHEARERAWEVVRAAWAEREPEPRRLPLRALVAVAAALALVGAALSPPGRAVIDDVREAIGVEDAAEALFSLPTGGRLLVVSEDGPWIVQPDGSKRLLGDYRDAAWSPFGRFVVATRANELLALEPDGDVRWSLARRDVGSPRWGGTRADTRIAYLSGDSVRVVAGDGRGDHRLARRAVPVPVAWRPGPAHVLTYARRDGFVRVVDADRGTVLARDAAERVVGLGWEADRRLVLTRTDVRLYDDSGRLVRRRRGAFTAAALSPRAQALALVRVSGQTSAVEIVERGGSARRVFGARGRLDDVAWSPDAQWLLVSWRAADQWLFVRAVGRPRILAVSSIAAQFGGSFPRLAGWCCPGDTPSLQPERSSAAGPSPSNGLSRGGAPVVWRRSVAVGVPWAGRLERGVRLPAEGEAFFTWDPLLKRSPSRSWRRVGTDALVRLVLDVLRDFRAAHPGAPRVGVGDLSRSRGGDFGPQWGGPGHVSHQNGLDVDVYYPRRDRSERPPKRAEEVDRKLAQDLVDRFVAAGAARVFVGPNVGLTGPRDVVQTLPRHDNHLHVRIAPPR